MTRFVSRGSSRIHWLDEGYAQTREALERCSISLDKEIAAINGFRDEKTAGDVDFYVRSPETDLIRSTLREGTIGSIGIYSIHDKGQIDWWHVKVTGVEDLPNPSNEAWPRFRITLTNA